MYKRQIRIAKYSGQSAELGIYGILWFICLISVNLGLFNLLPIPMLDGGHLAMYIAEMIRGKAVPMEFQEYAFKAVSYTHLDVYKRQARHYTHLLEPRAVGLFSAMI